MAVSSVAGTMQQALERCYKTAEMIRFSGKYYRRDIGKDLL